MKVHTRSDGKRYVDQDELVESVVKNMAEPTIDEMLEYLEDVAPRPEDGPDDWIPVENAIRAILEQHRDTRERRRNKSETRRDDSERRVELAAVRAFVERVEKRIYDDRSLRWDEVVYGELAALEAEWSSGSASNAKK